MSAMDTVEWEACLLEPLHDRDAERHIRKALGFVPPAATYFTDCAWIIRTIAAFNKSQLFAHLDHSLLDFVALVVSQDNSCRYCYAATRSVLKILGIPDARIRRLEEDFLTADLSAPERLALELARRVSHARPLATAADAAPLLDAGYSREAVIELAVLAALNVFHNRISTLPALPPESVDALARQWWVRLFRPLVARRIRPRRPARPPAQPLPADALQGPFAPFIGALAGLPAAPRLRAVVDDAFASPILSRRAKGLVFAVVARGLGCPLSEWEATQVIIEQGLRREQVEDVLANLSSPALEPIEILIVPFARETIWYQPAQIQRRAVALRSSLTRAQFVELVGVAALANAMCRLSVAVALARDGH